MPQEELEFKPVFDEDLTSEEAISNRLSEDVNQGVMEGDEEWTDPRTGSMFQIAIAVVVQELGRLWDALAVEAPSAAYPTRAWGDYLDEWIESFGKERNLAVKATGYVLFTGEEGALIPAQTLLSTLQTDPNIEPPEFVTTDSGGAISETLESPENPEATLEEGGELEEAKQYYVITAINDYGETLASTEVNATPAGENKKIALSWDSVTGATKYRIYRSTEEGTGSKKRIAEVVNNQYTDTGDELSETGLPEANETGGKYKAPIEAVESGVGGNVGIGAISTIVDGLEGVESVTNEESTLNGADEEDDDELRTRLLLEFQGGGAGNQTDYEKWALEVAGIGLVTVIPVADGAGTVKVVVSSSTGDPVSEDLVDGLQQSLDPLPGQGAGIAPIDHTVTVVTPELVKVKVAATIELESGFSLDGESGGVALRETIETAISDYIDNLMSGEDIVLDHAKAAIYTVEGVYKVTAFTIDGEEKDIEITDSPAQVAALEETALEEE